MGIFDRARRRPIRRTGDGTYAVDLDPEVRQLLGSFVDQLRELLSTDSDAAGAALPAALRRRPGAQRGLRRAGRRRADRAAAGGARRGERAPRRDRARRGPAHGMDALDQRHPPGDGHDARRRPTTARHPTSTPRTRPPTACTSSSARCSRRSSPRSPTDRSTPPCRRSSGLGAAVTFPALHRSRPPSSSGLGRLPFTQVTRVRIPLGVRARSDLVPAAPGELRSSLAASPLWANHEVPW